MPDDVWCKYQHYILLQQSVKYAEASTGKLSIMHPLPVLCAKNEQSMESKNLTHLTWAVYSYPVD